MPILDFMTVSIYEYVTKRRDNESKRGGGKVNINPRPKFVKRKLKLQTVKQITDR